MVDLGTLGGSYSTAVAISPSGQIVGRSATPDVQDHVFSWTETGGMVDLGTLGGRFGAPVAVSPSGQVVGYSTTTGSAPQHAFSWTEAGGMIDLGTLGGTESFAMGVSPSGQVVGYSDLAGDKAQHAFSWTEAGGMVDLGTLGGTYSFAVAINPSGQIAGGSHVAGDGEFHAVLWDNATDTTPPLVTPTITGTSGSNGWYTSDVTVTWSVGDPESGIIASSGCGTSSVTSDTAGITFTCSATNGAGLTSVESVTIRRDATPPSLSVPAGVVVNATSPAGAVVSFAVSASDGIDPNPTVACAPGSGHVFAIGDATVSCTAADAAGNTATASFAVHVKGAAEQLADLAAAVNGVGLGKSLAATVAVAQWFLAYGQTQATCFVLDAFKLEVWASGKRIPAAQATALIAGANRIKAVLGCGK